MIPSLASEGVKGSSWDSAVRRRGPGWRRRDGPWKQSQSAQGAFGLADGKLDSFVVGESFAPSERVRVLKVERGADYRRQSRLTTTPDYPICGSAVLSRRRWGLGRGWSRSHAIPHNGDPAKDRRYREALSDAPARFPLKRHVENEERHRRDSRDD